MRIESVELRRLRLPLVAPFRTSLGTERHRDVLLVHVLTTAVPWVADGYVSPQVYEDMANATRASGQKHLTALVRKAKRAGVRAKGLLLDGVPHERIVQAARSRKADLVVIGTHGRTGFAKLFLGSVASRVLAVAPCPVLTVRGK